MSVIWCGREVSRPYHGKRFWEIDTTSFQEIIISSGVFRRETASGFYPWGKVDSPSLEGGGGIVWLAAWKLVSNGAKRTIAPPNAKHSTLLQGCFFRFLFLISLTIRQQCSGMSLRYDESILRLPVGRWLEGLGYF